MAERLTDAEIHKAIKTMPGWELDGHLIRKTFERRDFVAAMGFVMTVAILAEKADHHPDIDIRWNKVTVALTTHSQGGLTTKDLLLAKEIDEA
jgi:4a-hydroxytetrahydrobiopterin dehydratase